MALEVLRLLFPMPGTSAPAAQAAESEGWDGLLLSDSQNLQAEVYVELMAAARATERIRLGTGVTNPFTRHPAVTASAIATLQAESGGRAVLGIGRGDSSVRFVGHTPAPVGVLEDYLARVQAYLAGGSVPVDGFESRIEWLADAGQPKVPVDVAATGPRTIDAGARHTERITFAVGAEPKRIRWAVEAARGASTAAGTEVPSLGAYVIVAPHPDTAAACDMVRANVGIFANFSRAEASRAQLAQGDRRIVEEVARSYDVARHGLQTASHTPLITDDFVSRFAVVGPSERCVHRLRELMALGLERFVVVGASRDADPKEAAAAMQRFSTEVLPLLRG